MATSRASRRPRRLRARPLLVAAGAVLTIASGGCGVEEPFCATHGICAEDMNVSTRDLGLAPRPDLGLPPDLTPRGD
jgi:hypothetical protein